VTDVPTFACALLLGFLGSAPSAGPATYVAVARAAERGRRSGLSVAAGAAAAEALYATLAFAGAGVLAERLSAFQEAARLIGALALLAFGLVMLLAGRSRPLTRAWPGAVIGFLLVLANPLLLLTWGALLATLRVYDVGAHVLGGLAGSALAFAAGFAVGVIAWFGVLLTLLRGLPAARLHAARRVMGILFVVAGFVAGGRALW